jgi:transposase
LLKPREWQGSFYDADYICEQLIPKDSYYRKFREIVAPLIKDKQFESMYCTDNGRPAISPSMLAMATILQFYKNLSDREMEQAYMFYSQLKYVLGLAHDKRPFQYTRALLNEGRLIFSRNI